MLGRERRHGPHLLAGGRSQDAAFECSACCRTVSGSDASAASRDALGQSLNLDGGTYTVIGVLPADFRYAGEPLAGSATDIAVWFPMSANQIVGSPRVRPLSESGGAVARRRYRRRRAGRRRAGWGWRSPRNIRNSIAASSGMRARLSEQVTGKLRVSMLLLLGTVGFVLLMACANVANLQLARAVARQREIAVRVALGAGAFRLMRQLLTEGFVLAAMGGIAGLPLAYAGLQAADRGGAGRADSRTGDPARRAGAAVHQRGGAGVRRAGGPASGMAHGARGAGCRAAQGGSRTGGRASPGASRAGIHAGGGGAGPAGGRRPAGAQLSAPARCESGLRREQCRDHLDADAGFGHDTRAARRALSNHSGKADGDARSGQCRSSQPACP